MSIYDLQPYQMGSVTNQWSNVISSQAANSISQGMPGMNFSFPSFGNFATTIQPQKEKVGFWEGLKAFGKGLIKPITSIIKHPLKSALMIGAAAALIIGTGGAAAPFLIAAGIGLGAFQMAKGGYNFFTKNSKAERLAALEDVGEGTFTVGASLAGARSYAKTTAGGSAVDAALANKDAGLLSKTGSVIKGFAQDGWTAIKAAPDAVKTTGSMMLSGEFSANLRVAPSSAKLAIEHREAAKQRKLHGVDSKEYKAAFEKYTKHRDEFLAKVDEINVKINERFLTQMENNSGVPTDAYNRFLDNGLFSVKNVHQIYSQLNPFRNDPSVNIALGMGSMFDVASDPEAEAIAQTAGKAVGFDFAKAMGVDPMQLAGLA